MGKAIIGGTYAIIFALFGMESLAGTSVSVGVSMSYGMPVYGTLHQHNHAAYRYGDYSRKSFFVRPISAWEAEVIRQRHEGAIHYPVVAFPVASYIPTTAVAPQEALQCKPGISRICVGNVCVYCN